MRRALVLASVCAAAGCRQDAARSTVQPGHSQTPASPDASRTTTSAIDLFRRCLGGVEPGPVTRHSITCDHYILQIAYVPLEQIGDASEAELLATAVTQSGDLAGGAELEFAGRRRAVRRYARREPDAPLVIEGLVGVVMEAERAVILHCIGNPNQKPDPGECAKAFTAVLRDGISEELLAALTPAAGSVSVDIIGQRRVFGAGCFVRGDDVKCANGQLSWKRLGSSTAAAAMVESEAARLTQVAALLDDVDRSPGCQFLGAPAACRQLELNLGAGLGVLRVFLISQGDATSGVFALCSFFPDQEPTGQREVPPTPCVDVLSLGGRGATGDRSSR